MLVVEVVIVEPGPNQLPTSQTLFNNIVSAEIYVTNQTEENTQTNKHLSYNNPGHDHLYAVLTLAVIVTVTVR